MCQLEVGKVYLTRGGYFAKVLDIVEESPTFCETEHYHYNDGDFSGHGVMLRTNRKHDGLWSVLSFDAPDHKDILFETKALDIIWDFDYEN